MEMENEELKQEYEEVFDGEEKAIHMLKITSDKYDLRKERIQIKSIGFSEPLKVGRKQTMIGLTKSIGELGVVTPIHVMTTEMYEEDEDDDDSYQYILLDGLRRIFGATKNNIAEIEAVIWDFHDKELGRQLALPLSLILNRTQKRSWAEVWDLYTILEMQSQVTPGTLEYLLQLEAGDAMKLKDVMLCDYSEVKEGLLSGEKSLDQCYKMLQKLRKEEDALANEDSTGFSDTVEDAGEIVNDDKPLPTLSDDDAMRLLEMTENLDDMDIEEADFNELNTGYDEQQIVGERHPLDPALKSAVLSRDKFKCVCCGIGGAALLGALAVHHKLPVHVGGKDTLENLVTLCLTDHVTLHVAERNGGKLQMTKEEFDEYTPEEQIRLKKVLKLAKVAVEADKLKGYSKEKVREMTQDSIRHPMPGTGLKENQQAYVNYKREEG